jgi:hypothetical protein
MPTSLHSAAATTNSSTSGRKSSRHTLRRVESAAIGHSTIQPATTNTVAVPAIPVRTPSSASVSRPTTTPINTPTTTAPASRVTAESSNQVFMREYRTELTHAR